MTGSRHGEIERRFTEIYRETARDILAYLLRRCPTAEDAADCLSETYAIAWAKRDRIPEGARARPWLFGVARNVMRRGRERELRTGATARQLAAALATAATVGCSGSETDDVVLEALARLAAIDQEILTLVAWDGLTPADIATILQMSPNLVRVRLHRARAKLRAALSTAGVSPAG